MPALAPLINTLSTDTSTSYHSPLYWLTKSTTLRRERRPKSFLELNTISGRTRLDDTTGGEHEK